MKKVQKFMKGIYLTREQLIKAEEIRHEFSKKSGGTVSFSAMIGKLIEDKKK